MLNPSTFKWVQPNTLVRFRGMIQDMLGNEFYVGAYKVLGLLPLSCIAAFLNNYFHVSHCFGIQELEMIFGLIFL